MASSVRAFYSDAGELLWIVNIHAEEPERQVTEADFAPHEIPGIIGVNIPAEEFFSKAPILVDGKEVHHELNKLAQPEMQKKDGRIAGLINAKINSTNTRLQEIEGEREAQRAKAQAEQGKKVR